MSFPSFLSFLFIILMVKRAAKLSSFDFRSSLVTAFLFLGFAAIIWRLFSLQILHGKDARLQADAQHSIYKKLFPSRGEIKLADQFSSATIPVATNVKSFLVYASPPDIVSPAATAFSLAKALQLDPKDVLEKITRANTRYVPLKKALSDAEQEKIKNLKLSGIFLDSEDTRVYPENNLLSQAVGYVGFKDQSSKKVGLYGLEKYFEKDLAGSQGELVAEKDTGGGVIFGASNKGTPAVDGVDLILTIDKTLQFQAQSIIKDSVVKNGADGGCIILTDPKTGAVLAMANYPDFNPNEYNKVTNPKDFQNMATLGNYEPGSVFKAITMAAALDKEKVTPETTYNDAGVVEVDGYKIKNSDQKAHGVQNMIQVLDESLNTGAIFAKEQIGNDDFYSYLQKFGFGGATGIELPEGKGNLDGLKAKIKVDYDTASFGQGISVTPLQLVRAYIALANQGKMMKPYIVQSKIYPDGKVQNTLPKESGQVISTKAANTLSAMLVSVIENGHGKKAGVPGYYLAGKTGTAQVPKKGGGYEENNNIGTFVGFGPVEDPKFVMLVRVDHPRDVTFAESTAAPAWGKMAQFILNYYHIAPTREINPPK